MNTEDNPQVTNTGKSVGDFYEGQLVTYIPNHAYGDRYHPDCENGRVTSMNDHFVFMRFGTAANSQACYPTKLM